MSEYLLHYPEVQPVLQEGTKLLLSVLELRFEKLQIVVVDEEVECHVELSR